MQKCSPYQSGNYDKKEDVIQMKYKKLNSYRSKFMLGACISGILLVTGFCLWWYRDERVILPLILMIVLDLIFASNIVMYIWADRTGLEFTEAELICHYLFKANLIIPREQITAYRYNVETGPKEPDGFGARGGAAGKERRSNNYLAPHLYVRDLVLLHGEEELLRWDMREQADREEIEKALEAWGISKE